MSDSDKKHPDSSQQEKIRNREIRERLNEALANSRPDERPLTKFQAPEPWPDPKDGKKKGG